MVSEYEVVEMASTDLSEVVKSVGDNFVNFTSRPSVIVSTETSKKSSCVFKDSAQATQNGYTLLSPQTITTSSTRDMAGFPPITSSGSKSCYVTVVNVSGSEEMLRTPEAKKTTEEDDKALMKGILTHSQHNSFSLSTRKRPNRRSRACGICESCTRPNCNKCRFCMDKPKNGGQNRLKKRCMYRECTNMLPARRETGDNGNGNVRQSDKLESYTSENLAECFIKKRPSSKKRLKRKKLLAEMFAFANSPQFNTQDRNLRKSKSESAIRTLRKRPFESDDVLQDIIEDGSNPKLAKLRKQLFINMAAPGTTLGKKEMSPLDNQRIHVRSPPPYEGIPVTGTLSPVPHPVSSAKVVTSSLKGPTDSQSGSEALDVLASRTAGWPRLPSSPTTAHIRKLGLPDNPAVWSPSHVQQYVAGCGFPEAAAQLMEEEVDGEAMLELTPIALVQCLKIKLGPAIKVCKCFEQLKVKVEASKIKL